MSSHRTTQSLGAIDSLLQEGLRRIANSAVSELGEAQDPLTEALRLTEEQTLTTLAAVEQAQVALQEIRQTPQPLIDPLLGQIEEALQQIMISQQGQDLAGQRLKKAIALLLVVESRIRQSREELGLGEAEADQQDAIASNPDVDQDQVDKLLAELGI